MNDKSFEVPWKSSKKCRYPLRNPGDKPAEGTSLSFRLLLGRLLTRSGDQAWDFAIPIVLLKLLPDHLRIAALYYLLIRLFGVFLIPRVASVIDTKDRMSVVRIGLLLQFVGVLLGAVSVYTLWSLGIFGRILA